MRECGLKLCYSHDLVFDCLVTPHAGVWIETHLFEPQCKGSRVTPHAGVWIETESSRNFVADFQSHSPCGSVD